MAVKKPKTYQGALQALAVVEELSQAQETEIERLRSLLAEARDDRAELRANRDHERALRQAANNERDGLREEVSRLLRRNSRLEGYIDALRDTDPRLEHRREEGGPPANVDFTDVQRLVKDGRF